MCVFDRHARTHDAMPYYSVARHTQLLRPFNPDDVRPQPVSEERIQKAKVLVIGAGYSLQERKRLEQKFGEYASIGRDSGPVPSNITQLDVFKEGRGKAKVMIDEFHRIRNGKPFEAAVVDQSVYTFFLKEPSPPNTKNSRDRDGNWNGNPIDVIDENSLDVQVLQGVLSKDGTLYFYDKKTNDYLEDRRAFKEPPKANEPDPPIIRYKGFNSLFPGVTFRTITA